MNFSLRQIIQLLLFILILVLCFQVLILVFPPERFSIFSPGRFIAGLVLGSIVFFHNISFNRIYRTLKQRSRYFIILLVSILSGWAAVFFLSRSGFASSGDIPAMLISFATSVFFLVSGLLMNHLFLLLTKHSNYLENLVIMKQLELDHLKNQLNPHFLFNSLNNVAATMQVDTELALNYIYTLSSLLRYQVESSDKESVTLAEENFFIESYLGIEEVRLGDRCELTFDSDISNSGEKIPPMLLQPFVEKAIKQSNCLSSKAVIRIHLQEKDRELFLTTKGTIPFSAPRSQSNGIGIENAIRRLEMFYPSSHRIINQQVNGFFETSLFIDLSSYKRIS